MSFCRNCGKELKGNEKFWDEVYEYIAKRYDLSKVKKIYVSGDGGGWIKAGMKRIAGMTYVLDEFGFWYSKTIKQQTELLQTGEAISIHLLMAELNGLILADIEDVFAVDSGDLPTAINRCLRQMRRGEQMRIVAPWYTAYGIEGTNIIKPYTNLVITLTISNE